MTTRIACAGLSGRIIKGRVNKAGDSFTGQTKDVTSDVLKAMIDKLEHHGGSFEISENGKVVAEISLNRHPIPVELLKRIADEKSVHEHQWWKAIDELRALLGKEGE